MILQIPRTPRTVSFPIRNVFDWEQIVDSEPALPTKPVSSLKQYDSSAFGNDDSENIDPSLLFSPSKGKGLGVQADNDVCAPHFSLTTSKTSSIKEAPQNLGHKRKAEDSLPTENVRIKRRTDPLALPVAPIGRLPPRKYAGLLSRRRTAVTRIDPPGSSSQVPFSLGAALAGTVPLKTKKKVSKKGWDFKIYEDSPQDEMANLMEHSTCILDISDEESRRSPKGGDRDNKENIPPVNYQSGHDLPKHPCDSMSEDTRTPLGDLDAKNFYADGCDATSAFLVDQDDGDDSAEKSQAKRGEDHVSSPTSKTEIAHTSAQDGWDDIIAKLSAKKGDSATDDNAEQPAFQIWESESAKEDTIHVDRSES